MAQRIQRKRTRGWRAPAGVVNVTRPSDWSNPFSVGPTVLFDDGKTLRRVEITRHLAVDLFAAWVAQLGWEDQIRRELAGRDLMCWCALDQECHADVLLAIANG